MGGKIYNRSGRLYNRKLYSGRVGVGVFTVRVFTVGVFTVRDFTIRDFTVGVGEEAPYVLRSTGLSTLQPGLFSPFSLSSSFMKISREHFENHSNVL